MDTQEARIYFAVIAAVLVIGFIIGYFAVSVIRQQRRNLELQKANALAEIAAMEKERARIAADLHDEVGPVLSTVKFRIGYALSAEADAKDELATASHQLDELSARMREIANNLMPSALLRKGLVGAIKEFAANAAASSGLIIEVVAAETLVVDEEKGINIYRVLQEIVHNSLKHSTATKIEIAINEKGNDMEILCRDNGKGFDPDKTANESRGLGLRSIQNRTSMMGSKLKMETRIEKGTAYLITIPRK